MNVIAKGKIRILVPLLQRAAESLKSREARSYLGEFDNTHQLAGFIENTATQFKNGDFSMGEKLWGIFAPTCEWDDAGGSQNDANLIFALLNPQFRPNRNVK